MKNLVAYKIVLTFIFLTTFVSCFNENVNDEPDYDLIPAKIKDKWGYIFVTGKFRIPPKFKKAYMFKNDLGLVQNKDGKYGYIKYSGEYKLKPVYKKATTFSENLAFVLTESNILTCIDYKGRTKFILKDVEGVNIFMNGLARIFKNGKFGFINRNGQTVIKPTFDYASNFNEGLAVICVYNKNGCDSNWGYINKLGVIVIPPDFKEAYDFKEGKALVYDGFKYGYININGSFIINPQYEDAQSFSEKYAAIKKDNMWGYINHEGEVVIEPQFIEAFPFFVGSAAVKSNNGKWGYIKKNGRYRIMPQFLAVGQSLGGAFKPVFKNGIIEILDRWGKKLKDYKFNSIEGFNPADSSFYYIPTFEGDYIKTGK